MKPFLRQQKLLERLEHHPEEKAQKDDLIIQSLIRLDVFQKAKQVLFYMAIHAEVDLSRLFEIAPEKKFILPRVNGKKLDLYFVDDLRNLEKGKYDILEPKKTLPKVDPRQIDLALIPGIVFSEDGHRIGFGHGFYDRLLKKVLAVKIGIAYEFQIVKNIGKDPHDVPMDFILTEKRFFSPSIP